MFTTLVAQTVDTFPAYAHLPGPGFAIFGVLFLIVLFGAIARGARHRRFAAFAAAGYGPFGYRQNAAADAEATLAEPFADGDIDAADYQARVKVLRENRDTDPAAGPHGPHRPRRPRDAK